jgi:hypothetical protein
MPISRKSPVLPALAVAALAAALAVPPCVAQKQDDAAQATGTGTQQAAPADQEQAKPQATQQDKARALSLDPGNTRPPRTGRFVGDHWTPYEPPAAESFPQGSTVHIIVKDDTLWDLSGTYLADPYLWPQIWDVNRYVTDSHWIYPGDPILVPPRPNVIGENGPPPPVEQASQPLPAEGAGRVTPELPASPAMPVTVPAGPALVPIADESDVECASYILDHYEPSKLAIEEREDPSRTVLGTGDIVFLSQGLNAKLVTGDEYTILTYEGVVPHPIFSEDVGDSVRPVGRLKIIALQEKSATAQIIQACDAVEVGMRLVPYEEVPVPITPPVDFRRYGVHLDPKTAGYIVDASPDKAAMGTGDIVNVDMGTENGVQPGDVLTVFREYSGQIRFDSSESYIDDLQARAERHRIEGTMNPEDYPQTMLGQLLILRTQKHTATAKVITSSREMNLGDRVAAR